jgi:hypothetical protein
MALARAARHRRETWRHSGQVVPARLCEAAVLEAGGLRPPDKHHNISHDEFHGE